MIYKVFDDMAQCCSAEIMRLKGCVSAQRLEQAMQYSHMFGQYCCLKSYEMLLELLNEMRSTPDKIENIEFQYNEYGAPYLQHGPYFSISHCKAGIAVVVSETPVGIDIEAVRTLKEELVHKTMNETEQQSILVDTNPDWAFIRLWTKKEAYLKMKGTGIISELKSTLNNADDAKMTTYDCVEQQYVVTIVEQQ